ncbi:chemotaxis protein CheR [Desulfuromonas versatilis]|uniref:protein-glutamate O-methyltransferase n=1 Tax=Desulfuromonas versatilis TaxID=2802975 RepID=A0ABM8HX05_9BACT|nr:protein-glutamate O-methyltransferase CheR [Desulfuromonas versatilis]BCR06866.1 chemotaxis protein CheR [Desulfuromonas versatilis]
MTEQGSDKERLAPFVGSEFPDEEFAEVRRILLDKLGFDLGMYKDRCIRRRVAKRVRALGLDDAAAYLAVLRSRESEVDALMTALTIHVSQFFRNPATFAALEAEVLPRLFARARQQGRRELLLWSVGCSSGEEPYSLALLVSELAPRDVRVAILGTDLSPAILERAGSGVFDPQRMTELPAALRDKYFTREGRFFRLDERIRTMVQFRQHNVLTAGDYPSADLILCRNVLIYFSRQEQDRILAGFAAALPADGFLVLGRAESMLGETRQLFSVENPEERIYRRR